MGKRLINVNDYAMVWLDGEFLGSRFRDDGRHDFPLPRALPDTGGRLDILVENCGRINYGPYLGKDPKGIAGMVAIEWQEQLGWEYWQLPLDDIAPVAFGDFDREAGARSSIGRNSVWMHLARRSSSAPDAKAPPGLMASMSAATGKRGRRRRCTSPARC